MNALDAWRQETRTLIPRGFLRRDAAEDGLFISDYPRMPDEAAVTNALQAAGYTVRVRDGLAHMDGTEEKYRAFLASLPCPAVQPEDDTLYAYSLAQRLIRADVPIEHQPLLPITRLLKQLDAGDAWAIDHLAAYAAVCQRKKLPLPSAAGKIILYALACSTPWPVRACSKGECSPC
ncbi:MAG: hypothetical protein IJ189_11280 [Clostridia bacterium]|nr:hypothetical protein [Clostridia bacterium]